jgi:hypothetical protein
MERVTSAARRIATDRLVLEPITPAIARAVAAGDCSADTDATPTVHTARSTASDVDGRG